MEMKSHTEREKKKKKKWSARRRSQVTQAATFVFIYLFISLSSLFVLVVVFFVRIGVVTVVLFVDKVRRCKPKFFLFTVNVNRVLETRFTSRSYVEKMSTQTQLEHANRVLKTRFTSPKSSLWSSNC